MIDKFWAAGTCRPFRIMRGEIPRCIAMRWVEAKAEALASAPVGAAYGAYYHIVKTGENTWALVAPVTPRLKG